MTPVDPVKSDDPSGREGGPPMTSEERIQQIEGRANAWVDLKVVGEMRIEEQDPPTLSDLIANAPADLRFLLDALADARALRAERDDLSRRLRETREALEAASSFVIVANRSGERDDLLATIDRLLAESPLPGGPAA